jgi:hypothetical protein
MGHARQVLSSVEEPVKYYTVFRSLPEEGADEAGADAHWKYRFQGEYDEEVSRIRVFNHPRAPAQARLTLCALSAPSPHGRPQEHQLQVPPPPALPGAVLQGGHLRGRGGAVLDPRPLQDVRAGETRLVLTIDPMLCS